MAIHKLDLDEFDEIDYHLIAIHTTLEDYRLAYFINQHFPINLSKSNEEIHISVKEGETQFSRFYFNDEDNFISWNLIQNKNEVIGQKTIINQDLFSDSTQEVATKVFLLPELKKVDYFLKIESDEDDVIIADILKQLKRIKSLSTVYVVDPESIKSKNNLIF
ncbi:MULTISPECIES: IPExxxVDY family protein [Flavobacterium]|uniref:IPExxxVDY family protein n=1 Tax=Flavobacterium keumense TaxID=1306518 RepID=A0ABY8N844_9FLAO|nr:MULTISPECIES: IPExxxVDY family protein [Flavobacterium]WGK95343.1 IPExxxVDY family protein [Flavobacterium keumense]